MVIEYEFSCPYCLQTISFLLDASESEIRFIEDCEVCCNPIEVTCRFAGGEVIAFEAERAQ